MDANFFEESLETGIGMIVRDEAGSFITSLTKLHQGLMTVDEWEVCGVVEVIKWMRELGFSHVIIEVDAKRACKPFN
ncbi:hypothetical protein ACS0TY_027673 [Phlomoides rotata]